MPKIQRKKQKIFAGSAGNNGQFGSKQAGSGNFSTNLDTLQALPAFDAGWLSAVISGKKLPPLEEFQALDYINTYQLAYLFQEGIPEYEAGTTYYANSIVKKAGSYQLYGSLTNDNTGNALTDATKWKLLIDLDNTGNQSLTANGYKVLPGGLIMQWGTVTTSASAPVPVTFPVAFPALAASLQMTADKAARASNEYVVTNYTSLTTTGFNATANINGDSNAVGQLSAETVKWLAIGY